MTADQVPVHPVPERLANAQGCPKPFVSSLEQYRTMWQESVDQPDKFFGNVRSTYLILQRSAITNMSILACQ